MSEEDYKAVEAARLYSLDATFADIAEKLEVSKSHAQHLVRSGIVMLNDREETSILEDRSIIPVEEDAPAFNSLETFGLEQSEVEAALGRTFIEQSLPIMRKIMLSPKIYLLYDYCRDKLDFQGDIGDFLADCVDYFFRANGFEISITHKSEILA